jgi:hypothetical protein
MEYYLAIKKNEIRSLAICRKMMRLETMMLSERSQSHRDNYCMLSILYGASFVGEGHKSKRGANRDMEGGKEKVGGRKERVIEEKNMFKAYYLYE